MLAARGETLTAEVRQGLQDHAPGLRKYALSLTRDAARADDLVQDTMLRAWMYRESFTPGTNVCGWLTIIMRNTFYSGQRKRVHEVEDTDGSYAAQLVTLPAQGAVLDLEDVNAAIGRLSTTLRQALTLVAIDNMTYDEAATVMGCKIGTVKSRVWRARGVSPPSSAIPPTRSGRTASPVRSWARPACVPGPEARPYSRVPRRISIATEK